MLAKGRIQISVLEQHVAYESSISLVAGCTIKNTGIVHGVVVLLMLFMRIAASGIMGHRHINGLSQRSIGCLTGISERLIESRIPP